MVLAAAEVGRAQVKGASLGSSSLDFDPGPVQAGNYRFRIGTAGATSLVLHTIYLPLALAKEPSTVTIEGGTHVSHSPCFHFLDRTWRSYMEQLGVLRVAASWSGPASISAAAERIQGRHPPRGRLCCAASIPKTRNPSDPRAKVLAAVAGLPIEIAHRQARRAVYRLTERGLQVETREETWPGGPGTMLSIELATEPVPTFFFALGERGKPAEGGRQRRDCPGRIVSSPPPGRHRRAQRGPNRVALGPVAGSIAFPHRMYFIASADEYRGDSAILAAAHRMRRRAGTGRE